MIYPQYYVLPLPTFRPTQSRLKSKAIGHP